MTIRAMPALPAMDRCGGLGVSPGRVVGPVLRMPDPVAEPAATPRIDERDGDAEAARIASAATQVADDLRHRAERADGEASALLEATALMATDPTLLASAREKVLEGGLSAARAVWEAADEIADTLAAAGGYLAERVRDVRDVRDRIVAAIDGRPAPGVPVHPEPFVLLARDLAPADTATLDPATVLALVTEEGGPTSHTAILARALGLPAVVAAHGVADLPDVTPVLVDGTTGDVVPNPAPALTEHRGVGASAPRFDGRGRTADGVPVALLANVADVAGAVAAADAGAEGIGLFRTEVCFLDRVEPPSIDEQIAMYREVFAAFTGRKVVVRTLDAGADKPLPFLTAAGEPNPALGVRGIRTARCEPAILDDQLAAIAAAAAASEAEVWVMAPMVATVRETSEFAGLARAHGLATAGVMVEVPAAALTAEDVLSECDFASIGTNDLAQYTLAADRQLGDLAELNDPWQPAVLRLIELVAAAGSRAGKPVGVCGEAAADPLLAPVLAGLGVTSLSMAARAIPAVAAALASVSRDTCGELARLACQSPDAGSALHRVRSFLDAHRHTDPLDS